MASIPIEKLEPGMTITGDLRDPLGRLLVSAGTVVNERHPQVLQKWGITVVEIGGDEGSDPQDISPEILEDARAREKERFRHNDLDHPFVNELYQQAAERLARTLAREATCAH